MYSIHKHRSKACRQLVVDDTAGTRLTCEAPAWVGKQHDLIVHYTSGSIQKVRKLMCVCIHVCTQCAQKRSFLITIQKRKKCTQLLV